MMVKRVARLLPGETPVADEEPFFGCTGYARNLCRKTFSYRQLINPQALESMRRVAERNRDREMEAVIDEDGVVQEFHWRALGYVLE
jgi:hypothetical protein